jgi:hypothetical protein
MFGFEHAGIVPDIVVTLSKAIGGGLPLAVMIYAIRSTTGSRERTPARSADIRWRWRPARRRCASSARRGLPRTPP